MKLIVVVLLAVGASTAVAQEPPFEVESLYHETGRLRFIPSARIDWESLAPTEVRDLSLPASDAGTIARYSPLMDMYGGVEVKSRVASLADIAGGPHYFVGPDGVSELAIDSALVVARLDFNARGTALTGRQYWGEVFGSPSEPTVDQGGFALRSETPLTFRTRASDLTADELLLGSSAVEQTDDRGYWGRGTAFWEIERQYRFTVASEPGSFVFVQWRADTEMFEAGCAFRYELYRIDEGGSSERIGWTSYGCDV